MDSVTDAGLSRDWMPGRVVWTDGAPRVEWVYFPERRFAEPFFEATLQTIMRRPFNLLFRHNTSMEFLEQWADTHRGIPPTGFIFHVSRCGSTLLSSLLGRLSGAVVLSEPGPVDAVLRAHLRDGGLAREIQISWLRAMVSALGRPIDASPGRLFIKFDAWNVLELPRIRAAFPDVPWVFVYRDPVEVLVSAVRRRGVHTIPGALEPALFGIELTDALRLSPEEYCARVLARIYEAGLRYHEPGRSVLVNYVDLPGAAWGQVAGAFDLKLAPDEVEVLENAAESNPKTGMNFSPDSLEKRQSATDAIREMAAKWLRGPWEELEVIRLCGA
ncbi:MAG TPA: hypothetical protein VIT21_12675 [Chthoniobacterales bacterium]